MGRTYRIVSKYIMNEDITELKQVKKIFSAPTRDENSVFT